MSYISRYNAYVIYEYKSVIIICWIMVSKPVKIKYSDKGKQILGSDFYMKNRVISDDDKVRYKTKKGITRERLRKTRIVRQMHENERTHKRWKVYRTAKAPIGQKQQVQMVVTVAWYKGRYTKTSKGYSTRVLASKSNQSQMFQEAFFSAKKNIGFSPTSFKVLETYYIYYKLG